MYRINRVYQNRSVVLIKVAGELTDGDLGNWDQFVSDFRSAKQGDVILDFCDVAWISPKAARQLVDGLTKNLLLLNCPTAVKNMACSSGLEAQVLDKDRYDLPSPCSRHAMPTGKASRYERGEERKTE